jgi:hypothetical protein
MTTLSLQALLPVINKGMEELPREKSKIFKNGVF